MIVDILTKGVDLSLLAKQLNTLEGVTDQHLNNKEVHDHLLGIEELLSHILWEGGYRAQEEEE